MIKKTSRLYRISLILIVFIMITLTGCNETLGFKNFKLSENYENVSEDVISENDKLALKWNEKEKIVFFYDKVNNTEWGYSSATKLNANGEEEKVHPQVLSPITVGYFDQSTYSEKTAYAYVSSIKKNTVYSELIDDGISVTYDFKTECFSVTVDYILREDSILVSVDKSKITETADKIVTKVAIAPYFCAAKNGSEDSYIFVPSGSGALIYPEVKLSVRSETSDRVYGKDYTIEEDYSFANSQEVRLPVYGVKSGDTGLCAIIESQPETCNVCTVSNNSTIGYTSVYSESWVRGYNTIVLPAAFGSEAYTKLFSNAIDETVYSVGFYPFGGTSCSYVDMAEIYRSYMTSKSETKLVATENKETAINLNMIGGVMHKKLFLGVPYQSFYKLTSIKQTQNILEAVNEKVYGNLNVILLGYTETGLDSGAILGGANISSKLGTKKDINNVFKAAKNANVNLFLDFDTVRFTEGGLGFKTKDAAVKADKKRIKVMYKNISTGLNLSDQWYYLLSREKLNSANSKLIDIANKKNLTTISLNSLSNMSYSDFASKEYYAKTGMSKQVYDILTEYKKNNILIAGYQANDYFAAISDHISDVPLSSAEYDSFDQTVPFYQIVYKGIVPMSSKDINSQVDEKSLFLKAVESGVGISFAVAEEYSTDVFTSVHNISYVYNKDELLNAVDKLKQSGFIDYFDAVKDAKIIEHQIFENEVRKTVFDNGIVVYVNYSDETVSVDGNVVEALNYIYVKG